MAHRPKSPRFPDLRSEQQQLIMEELKQIKEELAEIKKICSRMDRHVSFVESTYHTVRTPFNWLLNKISFASGQVDRGEALQSIEALHDEHS